MYKDCCAESIKGLKKCDHDLIQFQDSGHLISRREFAYKRMIHAGICYFLYFHIQRKIARNGGLFCKTQIIVNVAQNG